MGVSSRRALIVCGWLAAIGLAAVLFWGRTEPGGRTEPDVIPREHDEAASRPLPATPDSRDAEEALQPRPADAERVRDPEPTRAEVETFLRSAVETHLPSHKLPSEAYERLADAVLQVRSLQRELATLAPTPQNAERLARLRTELVESLSVFDQVLGMDAVEFTRLVQPEVGVTPHDDDELPAPAEYLEELPPRD